MDAATLTSLQADLKRYKDEVSELEAEHDGQRFPDSVRDRWNHLNGKIDDAERDIELVQRKMRLDDLSKDSTRIEAGDFQVRQPGSALRGDPYDLNTIARDFHNPEVEGRQLNDRARAVLEDEKRTRFGSLRTNEEREAARNRVEELLDVEPQNSAPMSRHMLVTGSEVYRRAFGKYITGQPFLTQDEGRALEASRALSLTGSAGGFAVPFVLDPTVIPTSNLAVNPFRAISSIENITVDEWRGVSSAGITASYAAEATATSDNAPTLAQPTISTEKAQAFIPFSIEIGMDWDGLQAAMGRLLADAKDELEATKFALGSGTNEPTGIITAATGVVTASGTSTFALADLDSLEAALGPRFRPRASIVMNRSIAQRIRHFDTSGAAGLWNQSLQLASGLPNNVPTSGSYGISVLGYPAYESSAMTTSIATGALYAVLGDFNYFKIIDRIGLSVETIPHLFDVTNNRPTGQRGLYAYWRNSSGVTSTNAFRVLKGG